MSKRTLVGEVIRKSSQKTVTVLVKRESVHKIYKKTVILSKKYAAHDESEVYTVGDRVLIEESRPISKTKSWVVKALEQKR